MFISFKEFIAFPIILPIERIFIIVYAVKNRDDKYTPDFGFYHSIEEGPYRMSRILNCCQQKI